MAESKVARLRTAHKDIIHADMPVDKAVATYRKMVREDMAPEPKVVGGNTTKSQVAQTMRRGGNVARHLAQRHQSRHWSVPGKGGLREVKTTFTPWVTSGPLNSFGEAVRVAKGIEPMDHRKFVGYIRKK